MHIHPNNNLQLASLGLGREEAQAIQAKRAAEVRRKLSAAARVTDRDGDEFSSATARVEAGPYASKTRQGQNPDEEDSFGRLFSAKA